MPDKFITLFAVVVLIDTDYSNGEEVIIRDDGSYNYAIYADREKADNHCAMMAAMFPDKTYKVVNSGLTYIN